MEVKATKSFIESLSKIGSITEKYYGVKAWIKEHFTKDFFRILKVCLKGAPYDSSFLLQIERAKLIEISNYIEKHKRFVGWEYTVRDMRICISLISIMLDERDLFHFNGNVFFEPSEEVKGDYEVKHSPDFEYVCDVKVNTKNADRFVIDERYKKAFLKMEHELYIQKAKYLYHKIRFEHETEWWD